MNQLSIDFSECNETIKTLEARRVELNDEIRNLRTDKAYPSKHTFPLCRTPSFSFRAVRGPPF